MPMKKIIIPILIAILSVALVTSCKRPKAEKNEAKQAIETPIMKMADAPTVTTAITPPPDETQSPSETAATPETKISTEVANPTMIKASANIEIMVDTSGSMNGMIGQTTKIDAVKEALKQILGTPMMPEAAKRQVALRAFGNKSSTDKGDCHDTTLEFPMGKYEVPSFDSALQRLTPQGTSPVAFALESANGDFSPATESTDNLIILIADGLDSCNGDIEAAAKRLNEGPGKVIVDIIGFDVDQAVQEKLKSLAKTGSGTFYLARSSVELANALDQALSAGLPYNLRVKVVSGATPLPATITIYRANTQSIADRAEAQGIKFFKLAAGTYDVSVGFSGSIESTKPSKIIKGVEVTSSSKAEQLVQFDLGSVNLTAIDQNGKDAVANFYVRKAGAEDVVGKLISKQSPQMIHLTPGAYDIDAETAEEGVPMLTAQLKGVEIKTGETVEQTLKFLTGKLVLKAQNVAKQPVPISYKITKPDSSDAITTGSGTLEGATIDLPPGKYDVDVTWTDVQGAPKAKLANIAINGGETLEQLATIVTGSLKLGGKDSQGKFAHTEYSIRKAGETEELGQAISDETPIEFLIAPGSYDIVATNTTSKVIPAPSVAWNNIIVKEAQTQDLSAVFKLGTIKLIGKNAKQQTIPTTFTVYRGGMDEPLVSDSSERDFVTFNLTPGMYDIKAEDSLARTDPKPSVWFHDTEIKEGQATTSEAIFTSGKLKLICRGKNNVMLTCEFNVFTYGSDIALFSGSTTEEWKEFDIPPGKYYMEAGWHDPKEEQFLKKWINLSVSENQIVEEVVRF